MRLGVEFGHLRFIITGRGCTVESVMLCGKIMVRREKLRMASCFHSVLTGELLSSGETN